MINKTLAMPTSEYFRFQPIETNNQQSNNTVKNYDGTFKKIGTSIDQFFNIDLDTYFNQIKQKIKDNITQRKEEEKNRKQKFQEVSSENFYQKTKGALEVKFPNLRADGKAVSTMRQYAPKGLELIAFLPKPHNQTYVENGKTIKVYDILAYYK